MFLFFKKILKNFAWGIFLTNCPEKPEKTPCPDTDLKFFSETGVDKLSSLRYSFFINPVRKEK